MISWPATGNSRSVSMPSTSARAVARARAAATPPRSRPMSCEFIASDEHQVAVGVEAAGELVAVEVEVALDGEHAAAAERAEAALPAALEAVVELGGGAVVEQRHPAGEREAAVRARRRPRRRSSRRRRRPGRCGSPRSAPS